MNAKVMILSPNGGEFGPFDATVTAGKIIVWDQTADIEEGVVITRQLPSGKVERHYVKEANFYDSFHDIPAHWQTETSKSLKKAATPSSTVVNITRAEGIQIGDNNTQTILSGFEILVDSINETNAPPDEKDEAKGRLRRFLEHPLIIKLLGSGTDELLSRF